MSKCWVVVLCGMLLLVVTVIPSYGSDLNFEEIFRQGIPSSPFIGVVYQYVDTMIGHGRDVYGPQQSGLFLSALDRQTLKPLEVRPSAPLGVREGDRPGPSDGPIVGANLQLDQNLLRLLYFLKGMSSKESYAQAADQQIEWFLKNTHSQSTGLLPWGEHLCWDVMTDEVCSGTKDLRHEFSRPWLLWGRCFELAPKESEKFALGLWENQVADHNNGAFDRHADYEKSGPKAGMDFPRHAGFYIRTWAEAYAHTKDETFLKAMGVLLGRFEKKRHPKTGLIELKSGSKEAVPVQSLSLAIDCDGAARKVPVILASRLKRFSDREDEVFCSLPHDLKTKRGFVRKAGLETAKPDPNYTGLWDAGYGVCTTAMVAMMCVSRYENAGKPRYRDLIVVAADAYMDSLPDEKTDVWPMTFGHAISLQLAAFRATADKKYDQRAFKLGEVAVEKFFSGSPLPRASLKTDHYESITGADTLALALAELHLSVLDITAVRVPINTIDR